MTDEELARALAEEAGHLLLRLADSGSAEGKALGVEGDRAANALILGRLARERPEDAVLSEEAWDDRRRCSRSRVWIVDPLDGTREYAEGRDDWAVHVALAIDGRAAVGAVALPRLGRVLTGPSPDRPGPWPADMRPRMVVSRTRPPALAERVAAGLDAEVVPMGSAGAKAAAVVEGRADLYLHTGGQREWDNCAPAAVALAAGFHASRADGRPLTYNQPDPQVPDLLICHPDLALRVLALTGAAAG